MTLRTEQTVDANRSDQASRVVPTRYPINFEMTENSPSLAERIIAAARVASAMHLTGAALISADEAALLALDSPEARS